MTTSVLCATILTFGLVTTAPTPATAQQQAGLVNVVVGDVIVAPAVNLAAALQIAANICGVQVGVIAAQFQRGTVCVVQQEGEARAVQIQRIRQ
jgi:hypothetical protein